METHGPLVVVGEVSWKAHAPQERARVIRLVCRRESTDGGGFGGLLRSFHVLKMSPGSLRVQFQQTISLPQRLLNIDWPTCPASLTSCMIQ